MPFAIVITLCLFPAFLGCADQLELRRGKFGGRTVSGSRVVQLSIVGFQGLLKRSSGHPSDAVERRVSPPFRY